MGCSIGNGLSKDSDNCFAVALIHSCCGSCEVVYTDVDGDWDVENNKWCGIKDGCVPDNDIEVEDDSGFDFSFLKMENNKLNMLYSPLSIKYALRMLEEGAVNNAFNEIDNVIGNSKLFKYTNINEILSYL